MPSKIKNESPDSLGLEIREYLVMKARDLVERFLSAVSVDRGALDIDVSQPTGDVTTFSQKPSTGKFPHNNKISRFDRVR